MGFLDSPEEKLAKQEENTRKALQKYGMEDLKDPRDIESVKKIVLELVGYKWFNAGSLLGNDSATLRMIAETNRVIMEQNFIIIRQLDRMCGNGED